MARNQICNIILQVQNLVKLDGQWISHLSVQTGGRVNLIGEEISSRAKYTAIRKVMNDIDIE